MEVGISGNNYFLLMQPFYSGNWLFLYGRNGFEFKKPEEKVLFHL